MKAKVSVIFLACSGLLLLGHVVPARVAQDQETEQQEQVEQARSEIRKQFMRGKLLSNQKIVEGLSLKDFALVTEGAKDVTEIVKGQHWFVLNTPEYQEYSQDMETAARRLHAAAKREDIEASALRYFDLTLRCIDCHQYLETLGH
jgi:hypothetical protein